MEKNDDEEYLNDYLNENKEERMERILDEVSNDFFGNDIKNEVQVFIEIKKGSNIKYEYDSKLDGLVCDRILSTPMKYFFNYGFIPGTKSEDGDELDALVLIDDELENGSYIKCKIIGCLLTNDNEGDDPKMIVLPISKVDKKYEKINDINNIDDLTIKKIIHFFKHYKDLEEGKFINIEGIVNKEKALEIYKKSLI